MDPWIPCSLLHTQKGTLPSLETQYGLINTCVLFHLTLQLYLTFMAHQSAACSAIYKNPQMPCSCSQTALTKAVGEFTLLQRPSTSRWTFSQLLPLGWLHDITHIDYTCRSCAINKANWSQSSIQLTLERSLPGENLPFPKTFYKAIMVNYTNRWVIINVGAWEAWRAK